MDKSLYTFRFKFLIAAVGTAAVMGVATGCLPRGSDLGAMYTIPGKFTTVDYSILKSQVLGPKCMSCHSEFNSESGVLAYVTPGDLSHSSLYQEMASGDMPPGGPTLPDASLEIVRSYITGLAPSNPSPNHVPIPDPSGTGTLAAVDFNTLKTQILAPKCMSCHSAFETPSGISEYVVAGNPDKSELLASAARGDMPPGGPALSPSELNVIRTYISGLKP